jgi:periplasmic divalent cation tolerance protein
MPDVEHCQVVTTIDSREAADTLASAAVEARVAACAQIVGPITSTYHWQGRIETASEWQILFKTTTERYAALEATIKAAHPYDVPEIVCTPIVAGHPAYLDWITTETALTPERARQDSNLRPMD